ASLLIYLNQGAKKNLESVGAPKEKLAKLFWGSWGVSGDFRPKLKVKSEKLKIVLYVGILSKRKGLDHLVAAMEDVRKKVPQAKLWLVGPRGDFTPPHMRWIRVFGAVKNSTLPKFFHKASVFVLPSVATPTWQEQVGMVNLQALGSGLPVVTSRSGAIPEFVRAGQGVLLVGERNRRALAEAISKILKFTPQQAARFGRLGTKFARQHYDPRANIQHIEEVLVTTFR
ncbi:glycosyltransferase family 4 protein, partial [Candidatus Berkelbacteria bacterium]|nr:glycosyltransferase family 4 protein [Candidatus Berkelbacteria bacterium]